MKTEEKKSKTEQTAKKIVAIRISGDVGLKGEIKDTLHMLNLYKKNSCVLVSDNPSMRGMLKKVMSYITWGDIDDSTLAALQDKRKTKRKYFSLHPPRKGYGRKGTKMPFIVGGALGDRKAKINDLVKRMI